MSVKKYELSEKEREQVSGGLYDDFSPCPYGKTVANPGCTTVNNGGNCQNLVVHTGGGYYCSIHKGCFDM